MFARSIRRVVFRGHDKSQCAALLKTTMGKAHSALSYQYFSMFFFPQNTGNSHNSFRKL